MNRLRYFLQEAWASVRLNRTTTLVAIGTTTFTLACFGVFLLLYLNVKALVGSLQEEIKAIVYLEDGLTPQAIADVGRRLSADREAAAVAYTSKEAALAEYRRQFPAEQDLLQGLGENPLPASFEVTVSPPYRSPDSIKRWAERTRLLPGVTQVQYSRDWIENLSKLVGYLELVALAVGTILAAASVTIIANTIRLTILARRDEIEVMKLIGATGAFVKIPYLLEGAMLGLVGSALSLTMLKGGFEFLKLRLGQPGVVSGLVPAINFFPAEVSALLVLAGLFVGCAGSLLSLTGYGSARL
jgi:cell division transport system permease protein